MNVLAILIAAIAGMVVGFLWYGPLFGKIWRRLSHFSHEDMEKAKAKGMGKTYFLAFISLIITAWVLDVMIAEFAPGTGSALRLAFLGWLGFIVPSYANSVLWEGKSAKLYYLNIAERLVSFLVIAGILAAW